MTDSPHGEQLSTSPDETDAYESIEAYETDDGVVFYDAENPLAWMEAGETVSLREQA